MSMKYMFIALVIALSMCTQVEECTNGCPVENREAMEVANGWTKEMLKKLNWEKVLECLGEGRKLAHGVYQLIKEIKSKEITKIIDSAFDLLKNGTEVVKFCVDNAKTKNEIEEFETNEINEIFRPKKEFEWSKVSSCLLKSGALSKLMTAYIMAVNAHNKKQMDFLAQQMPLEGKMLIEKCTADKNGRPTEWAKAIFSKINWDKVLACLLKAAPVAKDILDLIAKIKTKNVKAIITAALLLVNDSKALFAKCLGKSHGITTDYLKSINWNNILKCLSEAQPIGKTAIALIKAIKAHKYDEALELSMKLYAESVELFKKCFNVEEKVNGWTKDLLKKIDWMRIAQCLAKAGPLGKDIYELYRAIKDKKSTTEIIDIVLKVLASGSKLLSECLQKQSNSPVDFLKKLDIDQVKQCLISAGPVAGDIVKLLENIREGSFLDQLKIVRTIFSSTSELVQKCFNMNFENAIPHKITPAFLSQINWDTVLNCLLLAQPTSKKVLDFMTAIKGKDKGEIIKIGKDLIQEGSTLIKNCMNEAKTNTQHEINWGKLIKCLLKIGPDAPLLVQLIKAAINHQYDEALKIIKELYLIGSAEVKECLKEPEKPVKNDIDEQIKEALKFNWEIFVDCLKKDEETDKRIPLLIQAIEDLDVSRSLELIRELLDDGNEVVEHCLSLLLGSNKVVSLNSKLTDKVKQTIEKVKEVPEKVKEIVKKEIRRPKDAEERAFDKIKAQFAKTKMEDLKRIYACLKNAVLPDNLKEQMKELGQAVKVFDIPTAVKILKSLVKSDVEAIKMCHDKNSNGIDEIIKKMDWKRIIKCIKDGSKDIPKEIKEFIKLINDGEYNDAINLAFQLIKEGQPIIKDCFGKKNQIWKEDDDDDDDEEITKAIVQVEEDEEEQQANVFGVNWIGLVKCLYQYRYIENIAILLEHFYSCELLSFTEYLGKIQDDFKDIFSTCTKEKNISHTLFDK